MDHLFVKTEIQQMLNQGYEYSLISEVYRKRYPQTKGMSARSIRRFCLKNQINKNCVNKGKQKQLVISAVSKGGSMYGRKMITGLIRSEGKNISEVVVGKTLKDLNSSASATRASTRARNLNPKLYRANYFGHKVHVDQNEKLSMFGVTHICARDGFSGFIVAFVTMPIKNNVEIYEHIYRASSQTYGLWDTIRVDCGLEFVLMNHIQESLRHLRRDTSKQPVFRGKSTDNHIIERIWVEVNSRINYPVKSILNNMVFNNLLDMTDDTTKFCVSWVTCRVCAEGAATFVNAWNNHYIDRKGIPCKLAKENMCAPISANQIPSKDEAVAYYLHGDNKRKLTIFNEFGKDPLLTPELKELRHQQFIGSYPDFKIIFSSVVNDNQELFTNALLYFLQLTNHYSQ